MSLKTSSYKNVDLFRKCRERHKAKYRERTGSGKFEKREWTQHEINMVLAHDIPDRELSEKISRSVSAIQIMRSKLRKKADEEVQ